jgi:hypothetical protein
MPTAHHVGQSWHPIKTDKRYSISLEFCGYSVPMYCSRFCGDWIGCSRSLDRANHVCQIAYAERERALTDPV